MLLAARSAARAAHARGVARVPCAALLAATEEELIADARNGWLLCAVGHHKPKDARALPPAWIEARLPAEFHAFRRLYGLAHVFEREFRPSAPRGFRHAAATPRGDGLGARDPRA